MADKPIPFSGLMVLANNEGRKTNTRRILTIKGHRSFSEFGPSDTPGFDWHFRDAEMRWHDLTHDELLPRLKYQIGDRLWVREAWRARLYDQAVPPRDIDPCTQLHYEVDGRPGPTDDGTNWNRYRHARFMPRWASRTTLIVSDVRVQRLQDISAADAEAEGVEVRLGYHDEDVLKNYGEGQDWSGSNAARLSFESLWDSLNAKRGFGWDANPWVTATTYTVHQCNIDAIENANG